MSWLNRGGVPLLILIMIALASFAIAGFVIQGVAKSIVAPLPTLVASLARGRSCAADHAYAFALDRADPARRRNRRRSARPN